MKMAKYIWKIVLCVVSNFEFVKNYVVLNEINVAGEACRATGPIGLIASMQPCRP